MMETDLAPPKRPRRKNMRYCDQQKKGDSLLPYNSKITGLVIRMLREKRGVSQEVLSGFAGIARSHLTMIETGVKNPNVDTLWRIADALDMPLSQLILLVEQEINHQPK